DSLGTLLPRSDEALAARYWSGRAYAAAGNQSTAHERWRAVIAEQPTSYYAMLASRRLEESGWRPETRGDSVPALPAIDSAFARAELLDRLGLDDESRVEYDAIDAAATTPGRTLAIAHAWSVHGQPSRGMRLAQRLVESGQTDARVYRLLYPILDR